MAPWERLPQYLQESNRHQAEHILEKLCRIGCTVHKVTDRPIRLMTFTEDEIEIMAEMEHERWHRERLLGGWTRGEKRDVMKRASPYLVPSSELAEEVREVDRQMVRRIPELLAKVGLEIGPQSCRHRSRGGSR